MSFSTLLIRSKSTYWSSSARICLLALLTFSSLPVLAGTHLPYKIQCASVETPDSQAASVVLYTRLENHVRDLGAYFKMVWGGGTDGFGKSFPTAGGPLVKGEFADHFHADNWSASMGHFGNSDPTYFYKFKVNLRDEDQYADVSLEFNLNELAENTNGTRTKYVSVDSEVIRLNSKNWSRSFCTAYYK